MAEDLKLHDALLWTAVEGAGGEVFGHTGDGMCAVFSSAAAAVGAAVAAQLSLRRARWSGEAALRVRMAVHSGPAQRRAGNYFGTTLNRAARLMAVGAGGQVLCSQTTVDAIGDGLASGTALVDLGEHRLADLAVRERVYQVVHPDLPAEFPPLRSLGIRRHNLPAAIASFVGRVTEVEELERLLVVARLVTVTGAGGLGKTRLAVEVAGRVVDDYTDGVWLVELAAVEDGSLVGHAVAGALGLDTMGFSDPLALTDHVVEHLRSRRTLVVLDNCEHLLGAAGDFVRRLMTTCPDVTVLATSRELLGVPGEATWRVPPLSLPPPDVAGPDLLSADAVRLFWERARLIRPEFELTPATSRAVVRICWRLDGIPLALELAAARLRILHPAQIAERLDDCFAVLGSAAGTAPSRHRTLRAALDWSYELLSGPGQAALRRLGVFPATFNLDAAEAVIGSGAETVDVLSRLVDQSLLVVLDEGDDIRYRLLEPVRQYAAEQLSRHGEEEGARVALRDFFLGLEEAWPYPSVIQPDRTRRVCADEANFSAALDWSFQRGEHLNAIRLAALLWQTWLFQGRPGAFDRLEQVIAAGAVDNPPAHPARVQALLGLAALLATSGRADPARHAALLDEAARLAAEAGTPRLAIFVDFTSAERLLIEGRVAEAREASERAREAFEQVGDHLSAGWCLAQLGWGAMGAGDLDGARRHFDAAAALARVHDPEWLRCQALGGLAPLTVLAGDPAAGLELADELVATAGGLPTRQMLAMAQTRAAQTALLADDLGRAADHLAELFVLLDAMGTDRWRGDALEMAAVHRQRSGEPDRAAELFAKCDRLRAARRESARGSGLLADQVREARRALASEG